jgi:HemY protein
MRKLFAIALVALLLGVGIVAVIETDPGYVLVSYANYTLEASLWVGLLLLLLSVLSFYLFLQLTYRIVGGRRSLVSWLGTRKTRQAQRLSTLGLINFTEGNWQNARRQLLRGAQHNEVPLLNYLLAARASAQLQETDKIEEYLRAASEAEPGAAAALEFVRAELKLQAGEYQQAVTALDRGSRNVSHQPYALILLRRAYEGLNDWDKLLELLPQMQKHKLLSNGEFAQLQRQYQLSRFARSYSDLQLLRANWKQVPKHLQRDAALVAAYVANLIRLGDQEEAEDALLFALKQEWSTALVRQYGYVHSVNATRQLARAESWLIAHPEDTQLLLCLGRLSAREKLWGKARDYFESCYRLEHSAEVCAELGRLLTSLGQADVAAAYFREGLLLREDTLPELPMPDKIVPDSRLLARL